MSDKKKPLPPSSHIRGAVKVYAFLAKTATPLRITGLEAVILGEALIALKVEAATNRKIVEDWAEAEGLSLDEALGVPENVGRMPEAVAGAALYSLTYGDLGNRIFAAGQVATHETYSAATGGRSLEEDLKKDGPVKPSHDGNDYPLPKDLKIPDGI